MATWHGTPTSPTSSPRGPRSWGGNRLTPPDAPTTWHCQPEMAASNPRENGPFVSGLAVLGEQARAHRRAFPRPRSSLRDSCWPLETPRGQPLASVPWQMVAPLPFLPRARQLLLGVPSPALLPEASPPSPSHRDSSRPHASLACVNTSHAQTCTPSFFVGDHPGNSPSQL